MGDMRVREAAPTSVNVVLLEKDGRGELLGPAAKALKDARLTAGERAAIRHTVQGVTQFRRVFGLEGANSALEGAALFLRGQFGPAISLPSYIIAPTSNPFADVASARRGAVLPADVAAFEYALLEISSRAQSVYDADVVAGLADAGAMLVDDEWRFGEGYFRPGKGSAKTSLRNIAQPRDPKALDKIVTDYRRRAANKNHVPGVVGRTFFELRNRIGLDSARKLYSAVLQDRDLWADKVSHRTLALAIRRQSAELWDDQATRTKVDAALRATYLP
jgi:hypothetical protein